MNDNIKMKKNPLSLQLNADDFLPANEAEKLEMVIMRESVTYWKDAFSRFGKNKLAMAALVVIILVLIFAFILPKVYPYTYEQQTRGSENLFPLQYSQTEIQIKADGGNVFPHILGTDNLGRDLMIRIMMGSRISLMVGLIASAIILLIGAIYGAVSGYFGGNLDMVMMRIVDVIYTVPDILVIILLSVVLKAPLNLLFEKQTIFSGMSSVGPGLISIFITFSLLYWVGMARLVRGQVLIIKEQEYITAAKALGANDSRIIMKHLIPNCIGTIVVTTTLFIPSAIFTESFLSFLGLGVAAPMPSLGSLAADAIGGINSYAYRLVAPSVAISIIILSFNLFGDGLRDALDPKLKR